MIYPAGAPLRRVPPWHIEYRRVRDLDRIDVLETFLGVTFGLVMMRLFVVRAERVGGLLGEIATSLRFAIAD